MRNKKMTENNKLMKVSRNGSIIINSFFVIFCFICLLPLLLIISVSFSNESDIILNGFKLIPMNITFKAYSMILKSPEIILNAYKITIFVTFLSTILNLIITSALAYSLSRPSFRYRKIISFYLFFTMLFGGGLVPYYILMTRYLQVQNTIYALILPNLFNAYYAFLMRTNFQKLPSSLIESAKIDGASEYRIYAQMVIPLSTPTIATVGLLIAINVWNDWYSSLLFITDRNLYSLQMLLQTMLSNLEAINNIARAQSVTQLSKVQTPTESLRMAMCILALLPIIILFPFLQKYFVKGLTVGSVKG